MSDVGIYTAIEAEITAALISAASISTATSLTIAKLMTHCSVEDLIYMVDSEGGGSQGILVGISDAGAKKISDYTMAQRQVLALTTWEVSIVIRNLRGANQARSSMRTIVEVVRDRLHYYNSAIAGSQRFLWQKEEFVDLPSPDILAKVITFDLKLLFGQ